MLEIREATLDDKEQVFDLCRQLMTGATAESPVNQPSGEAVFRDLIETDKGDIIVADEDGTLLGLVTLAYLTTIRCGGIYASIEEFIVTEKARGKGVGGRLLEASIARATEVGCLEFIVNRPSDLGLPVYLRHGWKDAGPNLPNGIRVTATSARARASASCRSSAVIAAHSGALFGHCGTVNGISSPRMRLVDHCLDVLPARGEPDAGA